MERILAEPLSREALRARFFEHERELASDEEMGPWLDRAFDLEQEPAYRLVAFRLRAGFRLAFVVHHSLADGLGQALLSERLAAHLATIRSGGDPVAGATPLTEPDTRFRERLAPRRGWGWIIRMVFRHFRPLGKYRVRVASLLTSDVPATYATAHVSRELGAAEWTALSERAKSLGATRNDLLIAAALRASERFRRARSWPSLPYRLMLPVNLREVLGLGRTIQNFVTIVPAVFTPEEIADRAALVRKAGAEARSGRDLERAIETVVGLGVLSLLVPIRALRKSLVDYDRRADTFFYSLVVSSIRVPTYPAIPGVARLHAWIRGSLLRQPGVGLVFSIRPESVTVVLEYLRDGLRREEAEELLAGFFEELRE